MTTVKKDTIDSKKFEKKMIALIKLTKGMDMPENTRKILLEEMRRVHNTCLEWTAPDEPFRIIEELR